MRYEEPVFDPDAHFDRLLWRYELEQEELAREQDEAECALRIAKGEQTSSDMFRCSSVAKLLDPISKEIFDDE